MGATFTNIHIKKTDTLRREDVEVLLCTTIEKKGFKRTTDIETADETVILCETNGSGWITVSSGFFDPVPDSDMLLSISKELNTDVMSISCFDSDCLNMNLVNAADGTDAWVNVGRFEYEERESNYPEWDGKVSDLERFIEVTKSDYVFAEDVLSHMDDLMGLPIVQGGMFGDHPPENGVGVTVKILGFSIVEKSSDAPPKLQIFHQNGMPAIPGERQSFCITNKGGASKGLGIIFVGDYIKNDEITFTDCSLEFGETSIPIELKKIKNDDGSCVLVWQGNDIDIPPMPDEKLSYAKRERLEYKRKFIFRYTPDGNNRKFLDIRICVGPLQNWIGGQCVTYVWEPFGSKKKFIAYCNKLCLARSSYGYFPEDRIGFIREEDYDID